MGYLARLESGWSLGILTLLWGATVAGAATFTVVNTNASGAGSLAQAITNANAASDADDIVFDIPGGGVPTIVASLPAVTQPVTIDGTTQPGGFVTVQNGGSNALSINGDGSTVRGLVLNASSIGVLIGTTADNNTITGCRIGTDPTGTTAVANQTGIFIQSTVGGNTITNNLISGNTLNGVNITGNNNVVTGNVIGLDVTQVNAIGGGTGVLVNVGTGNRVGGTGIGEGNIMGGLTGNGVSLTNVTVANTLVQGNTIGTNALGDPGLGMSIGLSIASVTGTGNVIGGSAPGAGNVIVGSSSSGMLVLNSSNITIQGNTIGTAELPNVSHGLDLAGAVGNLFEGNLISGNVQSGLNLRSGANDNTIRGNEITGNGIFGIGITGGQRDRFTENSIHDNGNLGIDLGANGVTANDLQDVDVASGFNDAQNFPVLSAVSASQVTASLNSTPSTEFTVEFFASDACDASGNGEGETFLGALQVMTDGAGNTGDFNLALPPEAAGRRITATATAPNGNTSEFSTCSGPVPSSTTTTSAPPSTTSTSSSTTTSTSSSTSTTTSSSTTSSTTTTTSSTTSTSTSSTTTTSTTSPTSSTVPSTTTTTSSSSSTTTSSSTSTTTSRISSSSSTTSSSSSSSSTTTTPASTTTSTTLADSCATVPVGPTFRSLNCRLEALLVQVAAAVEPGRLQTRLLEFLGRAKERKEAAEAACLEPDLRRTRKLLKQVGLKTLEVNRKLRSRQAKKAIPEELLEALQNAVEGLRLDLRTLKRDLTCPDDAA